MTKNRKVSVVAQPPIDSTTRMRSSACLASDGSQPISSEERDKAESPIISADYHLTARSRFELTRRQQSLLLDVLCYQAVHFGISFGMYLFIEMLYFQLAGSKTHPTDVKDEYERRTTFVAHIILMSVEGVWHNLENLLPLDEDVRRRILQSGCLMNRRTYGSRLATWRPERILEVKAVRMDVFMERSGNSAPYSSYCKGYGESHPSRHRQKTKPSFELDGDETETTTAKISLRDLPSVLNLNAIELFRRFHRKRN